MKRKKEKQKAVALKYEPLQDNAPRVKAKGQGIIAERIIALAEEHGIPVKDDADLIEVLSKLDIGEEIPPEVYVAVAEILAFVYSLNSRRGKGS